MHTASRFPHGFEETSWRQLYLLYLQHVDIDYARDMPKAIWGVGVLKWLVTVGFPLVPSKYTLKKSRLILKME